MAEFTEYTISKARAEIYLARYLLTLADNRGLTHGEKHYIIQTVLKLLQEAGNTLGDNQSRLWTNEVDNIEPSDIPF